MPADIMPTDDKPLVLSNARLVLTDRVIEAGWIAVADGMIAGLGADRPPAGAEDVAGDFIIPGLIELHTDHLGAEAHYMPRPKLYSVIRWLPWCPMTPSSRPAASPR